jgi:hypothetical protein
MGITSKKQEPYYYCDYCDGEIYGGEVYYCADTGDIIHTDCLLDWARGLVRICDIEELMLG